MCAENEECEVCVKYVLRAEVAQRQSTAKCRGWCLDASTRWNRQSHDRWRLALDAQVAAVQQRDLPGNCEPQSAALGAPIRTWRRDESLTDPLPARRAQTRDHRHRRQCKRWFRLYWLSTAPGRRAAKIRLRCAAGYPPRAAGSPRSPITSADESSQTTCTPALIGVRRAVSTRLIEQR